MKKETVTTKDKKTTKKPANKAVKKNGFEVKEESALDKAMRALWQKYHESHKKDAA